MRWWQQCCTDGTYSNYNERRDVQEILLSIILLLLLRTKGGLLLYNIMGRRSRDLGNWFITFCRVTKQHFA